ncbi:MAG TPA: hypothetical protein VF218_13605 [Acidothermaceae bacterium]|jgi:hypothetical protein
MNVDDAMRRVQRLIDAEKQMADDERARAAADNERATAAGVRQKESESYSAAARTHLRAAQLHDDAALLQATHRDHLIALSARANRFSPPLT